MSLVEAESALRRGPDGGTRRWFASETLLQGSRASSGTVLATGSRIGVVAVTRDWEFRERLTLFEPALSEWRYCRTLQGAIADVSLSHARSLVILDIGDPAAPETGTPDAYGMLRDLRRNLPDLYVLAVISEPARPVILAVLACGVHGVIAKSAGRDEIREAVDDVARGRIYVPAAIAVTAARDGAQGAAAPVGDDGRAPSDPRRLTPRQRQVLERLVAGKSNKEIARDLCLGEGTVKVHLAALLRCLKVSNRTAAAAVGARLLPQ
jgi:DNA-binding NarL/FixJ family response regulator